MIHRYVCLKKMILELLFLYVYDVVWNGMFLIDEVLNTSSSIYAGSAVTDAAWLIDVMKIHLPI